MVKYASALIFAALIAAPALATAANGNWDDLNARDLETLASRELTESESLYAREVDQLFTRFADELDARGLSGASADFADLAQRSKIGNKIKNFFKKVWHGIKKVASVILKREDGEADESLFGRAYPEIDEIEARELDELFERYVADIEERSPGFLHFMKHGMSHVKEIAHAQPAAPTTPSDSTSVDARAENDFYLSARALDDILEERDLDLELDLSARDFDFAEEMYERELLDEEEMFGRAYEVDELD